MITPYGFGGLPPSPKGVASTHTLLGVTLLANAVGKILDKAIGLVLRMRPLLDYIVSPEQKAFQTRKYIAENTQLV